MTVTACAGARPIYSLNLYDAHYEYTPVA